MIVVICFRMEGEGEFTDTEGQIWTGQFRYKAAPGLRFKLGLWLGKWNLLMVNKLMKMHLPYKYLQFLKILNTSKPSQNGWHFD